MDTDGLRGKMAPIATRNLPFHTLTELIHEGSDTLLCRGYRTADRVPVTIKMLKAEHPHPRLVARLRHEYLISRDLDHEHLERAALPGHRPAGARA
jgi:hypothetical protein